MPRNDISDYLVHFTRQQPTREEELGVILNIVGDKCIRCTTATKGNHCCVCFTESPTTEFVNATSYSRYSSFGFIFTKSRIFRLGGRPVIYQSDDEYCLLPDSHKWRHVRYDLTPSNTIDWTWEREWRVNSNQVQCKSSCASILVPDELWAQRTCDELLRLSLAGRCQVHLYSDVKDMFDHDYEAMLKNIDVEWHVIRAK